MPSYNLIRDRDAVYGGDFRGRAAALGIETVLTPARAPRANAVAEREIGSLRRECLDHAIPLDERHLRHVLREYVDHDTSRRPHRALRLRPPAWSPGPRASPTAIVRRDRLGGLLHDYESAAA